MGRARSRRHIQYIFSGFLGAVLGADVGRLGRLGREVNGWDFSSPARHGLVAPKSERRGKPGQRGEAMLLGLAASPSFGTQTGVTLA